MTTAIILAGGLGTRLRSVVSDLPKPMAPVAGRPFLEHLLDYWIAQGISRFILSVGYRSEAIVGHFGDSYKTATLNYSVEESPLGTGGAVLLAAKQLDPDTPFLLVNGDTYFEVELPALQDFSQNNNADLCFSLFRSTDKDRYMGMDVLPDGRIAALKASTGTEILMNGGVYWLHPRILRDFSCLPGDRISLEDDIFPKAQGLGCRFFGLEFASTFIDIGVPADYHRAQTLLSNGAPDLLSEQQT
jgi:D-glycero-alpha-D-manno-heptose 1-phosphate guanylyltransferase